MGDMPESGGAGPVRIHLIMNRNIFRVNSFGPVSCYSSACQSEIPLTVIHEKQEFSSISNLK